MPEYDQITIQGHAFRVPLRYKEGDTLKANEAGALNQTYHENIRNNMASKIRDGVEAGVAMDVLQQQVDDYANDYQFGVRTGGGGFRGDPVMTLAMNLAREVIRRAIKKKGLSEEDWPASRVSQAAKQLLDSQGEDGNIVKHARESVEKEKAQSEAAMAEVSEILETTAQAAQ